MKKHISFVVLAMLVVGCSSTSSSYSYHPFEKIKPTKNKNAVIGSMKWKVVEVSRGKVLASGDRKILLGDAVLLGQGSLVSAISLGNHFYLGRPEQPESSESALVGFGLTLEKDDEDIFSWDWFTVDSPTHATKLQEGGELGIEIGKYAGGYSVRRIDFQSDVSMRGLRRPGDSVDKPRWRAEISKGSSVNWPTVENGEIVAK